MVRLYKWGSLEYNANKLNKILSFLNYHIFQVKPDCNIGQCILLGTMYFVLMIRLKEI